MRVTIHIIAILLLTFASFSATAAGDSVFDHSIFDRILHENVRGDRVDYLNIRKNHWLELNQYLDNIATVDPKALSNDERLALYINAYNATVIKTVIEEYHEGYTFDPMIKREFYSAPAESEDAPPITFEYNTQRFPAPIRIHQTFMQFIHLHQRITLGEFAEFRAHAALCSATRSSPRLRNRAYIGENIDDQLDEAMHDFLTDKKRNDIDPTTNQSRINSLAKDHHFQFGTGDKLRQIISYFSGIDITNHSVSYLPPDHRLNLAPPESGKWITTTKGIQSQVAPDTKESNYTIKPYSVLEVLSRRGDMLQVHPHMLEKPVWISAKYTKPFTPIP